MNKPSFDGLDRGHRIPNNENSPLAESHSRNFQNKDKKKPAVGGQAVIEGVMMRSPFAVATAVRNPAGDIVVDRFSFISLSKKNKFWGLPILRGAVALTEAMYLGVKTLNWSAAIAAEEDGQPAKSLSFKEKAISALTMVVAFGAGMGIFMYIPYLTAGIIRDASGSQFLFHAVAGTIRIGLFLLYLYLISLWKEIGRVFEYHGAEHKSIFAFEITGKADAKKAAEYPRLHPRCGTSFLLITAVIVIFLFAILDSILVPLIGEYSSPLHRLAIHLPFIPLVAGVSYEVLKFSGEKRENWIWKQLIKPGLWLQHITTKEPDESQLEVAVAALESSLNPDFQPKSGAE